MFTTKYEASNFIAFVKVFFFFLKIECQSCGCSLSMSAAYTRVSTVVSLYVAVTLPRKQWEPYVPKIPPSSPPQFFVFIFSNLFILHFQQVKSKNSSGAALPGSWNVPVPCHLRHYPDC